MMATTARCERKLPCQSGARGLIAVALFGFVGMAVVPAGPLWADEYTLTKSEKGLDCRRMAGRMQIRILELRDGGARSFGSVAAEGLQGTVVPLFGGTSRGLSAAEDAQRDLARLRAMNAELISRKCPHYDLDAELAKDKHASSPRLIHGGSKAK
ncbi:MAG: hypothetical protein H6875_06590 [Hyphomicrobiaceae bacterium]|nr:hypothetical protein [Hyphomicrobiaceae bacterium]